MIISMRDMVRRSPTVAAGLFLALGMSVAGSVNGAAAATMTCTTAVSDVLSTHTGCEVTDGPSQDFLNTNPITVNGEEFFGPDDWAYAGKYDIDNSASDASAPVLAGTNVSQSGTMTILASLWADYGEVMAIFKSGNEPLTGYLLKAGDTVFSYDSPFLRTGKNSRDISHVSLYGRGTGGGGGGPLPGVPLPAAGWMLIAGLGGLAAVGRRRKS